MCYVRFGAYFDIHEISNYQKICHSRHVVLICKINCCICEIILEAVKELIMVSLDLNKSS